MDGNSRFTEWMLDKVPSWKYDGTYLTSPDGYQCKGFESDNTIYKAFLQDVIETLNIELKCQNWISIECDCICCTLDHDEEDVNFFYDHFSCMESAKLAALLVFFKREVGDGST